MKKKTNIVETNIVERSSGWYVVGDRGYISGPFSSFAKANKDLKSKKKNEL